MIYTYIDSPLGQLLAAGTVSDGVTHIALLYTPGHDRAPGADWVRDDGAFTALRTQLAEYFAGTRTQFDLPLAATGTAFQHAVWSALRRIGYARTVSYADIAAELGSPTAVRAVGGANGRNPISIIVPCHRVIGADGSLTGYAGGVAAKRWLLEHEATVAGKVPVAAGLWD